MLLLLLGKTPINSIFDVVASLPFAQLVNRHKNSKKKNAVSLTQEMLSEFNKAHMGSGAGGLDNYGADDLYNMDDVWNDKQMDKTFDRKPTKVSAVINLLNL